MLKKLLVVLFSILVITISTKIHGEDIDVEEKIINNLKSFGVDIENLDILNIEEIEPIDLKSFESFSKEDLSYQKEYLYIWSTIWHGYVDILDIKTQASSTLKGYPVNNLFDKKTDTAWVAGSNGIGEWISINIHTVKDRSPSTVTLFGIISGYLKSNKTWEENNRVKTAILVIKTPSKGFYNFSDEYAVIRLKLKDFKGLQIFNVNRFQNYETFDRKIWLIIEDIYPGTKYSDTCISEIYLRGACHPPSP